MKPLQTLRGRALALLLAALLLLCTGCGDRDVSTEEAPERSLALLLSQEDEFLTTLKTCIEA